MSIQEKVLLASLNFMHVYNILNKFLNADWFKIESQLVSFNFGIIQDVSHHGCQILSILFAGHQYIFQLLRQSLCWDQLLNKFQAREDDINGISQIMDNASYIICVVVHLHFLISYLFEQGVELGVGIF